MKTTAYGVLYILVETGVSDQPEASIFYIKMEV